MKSAQAARASETLAPNRRAIKLSAQAAERERKPIPGVGAGPGLGRSVLIDVEGVSGGIHNNISVRIGHSQESADGAISVHAGVSGHDKPEFAAGHIGAGQILDDILGADTQSANAGVTLIIHRQTEVDALLHL